MNIFMMPSWYPSQSHPARGGFFKDQAIAFSKHIEECNLTICALHYYHLSPSMKRSVSQLKEFNATRTKFTELNSRLTEIQIPILTAPSRYLNMHSRKVFKTYEEAFQSQQKIIGSYDCIWAHVATPAGYHAALLGARYKLPVIITEHMGPFPLKSWINGEQLLPPILNSYQRANAIVAVSSSLAKKIETFTGIQTDIIPNPVRDEFFETNAQRHNATPSPFKIVTVARLINVKGIDLLLQAIKILKDRGERDIHLTIVGDGSMRAQLQALALTIGLSANVTWVGAQPPERIRSFLEESDIFVMPSRSETFGVACAEAQACGKPVVATKCGGPEDIISNATGVLAESESPQDLARKIAQVRRDYQNYNPERIQSNCRNKFSEKVFSHAYYSLFQRTMVEAANRN